MYKEGFPREDRFLRKLRCNTDLFYSECHEYMIYVEKNLKSKNGKVHCDERCTTSQFSLA